MDILNPETDPTLLLGLHTAEAERINRWINVGFLGLVKAVDEKVLQIDEYEATVTKWDADCKAIIAKQDEAVEEVVKPKKRFFFF